MRQHVLLLRPVVYIASDLVVQALPTFGPKVPGEKQKQTCLDAQFCVKSEF
jgi:hypothetical protein